MSLLKCIFIEYLGSITVSSRWTDTLRLGYRKTVPRAKHTVCGSLCVSLWGERKSSRHTETLCTTSSLHSVKIYASPAKVCQFIEILQYEWLDISKIHCSVSIWIYSRPQGDGLSAVRHTSIGVNADYFDWSFCHASLTVTTTEVDHLNFEFVANSDSHSN